MCTINNNNFLLHDSKIIISNHFRSKVRHIHKNIFFAKNTQRRSTLIYYDRKKTNKVVSDTNAPRTKPKKDNQCSY